MRDKVRIQVHDYLAAATGLQAAAIRGEASFQELGIDSVAGIELLAHLEDTFQLYVPPDDAIHLTTVDAVVHYVCVNAS